MDDPSLTDGEQSDDVIDQERARIERAEIEGRRKAVEQYAEQRRKEAMEEELDRLQEGKDRDDEPPGFFEWLSNCLRPVARLLKQADQQMMEAHSSTDEDHGEEPGLDTSTRPQMPDPLGGGDGDPTVPDPLGTSENNTDSKP